MTPGVSFTLKLNLSKQEEREEVGHQRKQKSEELSFQVAWVLMRTTKSKRGVRRKESVTGSLRALCCVHLGTWASVCQETMLEMARLHLVPTRSSLQRAPVGKDRNCGNEGIVNCSPSSFCF